MGKGKGEGINTAIKHLKEAFYKLKALSGENTL